MSFGEDERGAIDHTVKCDKCKRRTEYWNCLMANGKTICDNCCTTEEKEKRDRLQASQAKSFSFEMDRLNNCR